MAKSDPPPAPDYRGAAQQTGESTLQNTQLAAKLNRPDVYSPLGSSVWTSNAGFDQAGYDRAMGAWSAARNAPQPSRGSGLFFSNNAAQVVPPPSRDAFMIGGDKYTNKITLSPEQQKLFETGQAGQLKGAELANTRLNDPSLTTAFDPTKVSGGQQEIQDALYRRSTAMLDPQFQQQESAERDRLAQQGFQVGNAGYDKAIGNFDRSKAAAYGDARDRAIIGGQAAQQQAVSQALAARGANMNEINALRTGSQVTMPSFGGTPAVGAPAGTDFSGATTAAGQNALGNYGMQVGKDNQTNQALTSAAAMAAMYAMGSF